MASLARAHLDGNDGEEYVLKSHVVISEPGPEPSKTQLDWNKIGREQGDPATECTFWTCREGQMCVQYFRPGSDVHYRPHTHSEYTIVVCLEGEVAKRQLAQDHLIGPGEVMIGNHGVEHSSTYMRRRGRQCEAVTISLDRRLLAALTRDFDLPPLEGEMCAAFLGKVQGSALRECALSIATELRTKQVGHQLVVETQAIRLLVETIRAWPRRGMSEIRADTSPQLPRREFVRAYEFMRWCRKDSFRLQHLCRFLGSSEERFNRLFLASTNHTPASFYNRMLLERAVDLLRNPRLSIKEIGYELGFRTSSHFVAAFRREFAVSPQESRERGWQPTLALKT